MSAFINSGGICNVIVIMMVAGLLFHVLGQCRLPLWFDEVWRAYGISTHHLVDTDNCSAPVPLALFLLTSVVTSVQDNEITQRLPYILFALSLPVLLYVFGVGFHGRLFGVLLAVLIPFGSGVLEYAAQNKPYVVDSVCTLLALIAYLRCISGAHRPFVTALYSCALLTLSIAVGWSFIGFAIYLAVSAIRNRANRRRILVWASITGVFSICYYILILRPQAEVGLVDYWAAYSWRGFTLSKVAGYLAAHVKDIFATQVLAHRDTMVAAWSGFLMRHLWILFGVLFIGGAVLLVRHAAGRLLLCICGMAYLGTFAAAYYGQWAFGACRLNLFLFVMTGVIASYGICRMIEVLFGAEKYRWLFRLPAILLVLFMILLHPLPYVLRKAIDGIRAANASPLVQQPGPGRYLDSMRLVANKLRGQITSNDTVLVYHFMTKKSFLYYFRYYENGVVHQEPRHYMFDRREKPLAHTPEFFAELAKEHPSVWVVFGNGYGMDPTDCATNSYVKDGHTMVVDTVYYAHMLSRAIIAR